MRALLSTSATCCSTAACLQRGKLLSLHGQLLLLHQALLQGLHVGLDHLHLSLVGWGANHLLQELLQLLHVGLGAFLWDTIGHDTHHKNVAKSILCGKAGLITIGTGWLDVLVWVLAQRGGNVLRELVNAFLVYNASLQHEAIHQDGAKLHEDLGLHGLVGIQAIGLKLKVKAAFDLARVF